MLALLWDLVRGLAETIREVLPTDEQSAGPWLAGFCAAMALHWTTLILVTWAACRAAGSC